MKVVSVSENLYEYTIESAISGNEWSGELCYLETDYETCYISVFYEPVALSTDTESWTIK